MIFTIESKFDEGDIVIDKSYEAKVLSVRFYEGVIQYLCEYEDCERHWIDEDDLREDN